MTVEELKEKLAHLWESCGCDTCCAFRAFILRFPELSDVERSMIYAFYCDHVTNDLRALVRLILGPRMTDQSQSYTKLFIISLAAFLDVFQKHMEDTLTEVEEAVQGADPDRCEQIMANTQGFFLNLPHFPSFARIAGRANSAG